jgi:signal transduction histidine kinase/DNA-binding response OmpR family regulator
MRAGLGLTIGAGGLITILIALGAGEVYRSQTLRHQQDTISRFLQVQTESRHNEFIEDLTLLGLHLQSSQELRAALAQAKIGVLQNLLQSQFKQYSVSVGNIPLRYIYVFNGDLKLVTGVVSESANGEYRQSVVCHDLVDTIAAKGGFELKKIADRVCSIDDKAYQALLIPVGGILPKGYLLLVAELVPGLVQLQNVLDMPVQMLESNGSVAYQSPDWPDTPMRRRVIYADYELSGPEGDPILHVKGLKNLSSLYTQLNETRFMVMGVIVFVVLLLSLITISIWQKTVISPLQLLTRQLGKVNQNRASLGKQLDIRGNREVRELIKGFNHMTMEVQALCETLSHSNSDLEREIHVRRRIESEIKRARDEAVESSKMKSEFLANISHEIRTPMSGVLGMLEMLRGTRLNPEQYDYVEMAKRSGDTLLNIINDILDLSKMEASRLSLEKVEFDLEKIVQTVIELFADQARNKGLNLHWHLAEDVPGTLIGDPTRLQQILINLIGNAVKFTQEGEVCFSVRCLNCSSQTPDLRFEVRDTGIGIPQHKRARIFESFSQADGSTTRKFGGTGLGLAIVKQLTTLMDGDVGVESNADKGSTFWFTARFESPAIGHLCLIQTKHRLRSLIVMDKPSDSHNLVQHLDAWGIASDCIYSGGRIFESLHSANRNKWPYDFVFIAADVHDVDYVEVARQVSQNPNYRNTAMIAVVAPGQSHRDSADDGVGIADHIRKPVQAAQLYNCITSLLAGSPPRVYPTAMAGAVSTAEPPPPPAESEIRVLVGEDNDVNQKVAMGILKRLGYQVDLAVNGAEAVDKWKQYPYDIIFMDCQMPVMDGYDAASEIRRLNAIHKNGCQPAIIAMTAHPKNMVWQQCQAAGMDDFINKPIKPDMLKTMLERWTRKAAAARQAASIKTG